MYIDIYICMCIYIYVYIHVYTCVYLYVYVCIPIATHHISDTLYVYSYTHICTRMIYVCTRMHVRMLVTIHDAFRRTRQRSRLVNLRHLTLAAPKKRNRSNGIPGYEALDRIQLSLPKESE